MNAIKAIKNFLFLKYQVAMRFQIQMIDEIYSATTNQYSNVSAKTVNPQLLEIALHPLVAAQIAKLVIFYPITINVFKIIKIVATIMENRLLIKIVL